jgi:hypothetical protein
VVKKGIESHGVISLFHEVATTKMEGGGPPLLKVCWRHRRGVGPRAQAPASAKETEEHKGQGQQRGKAIACEKMQTKMKAERVDKA